MGGDQWNTAQAGGLVHTECFYVLAQRRVPACYIGPLQVVLWPLTCGTTLSIRQLSIDPAQIAATS